jgi:hypothetical protein
MQVLAWILVIVGWGGVGWCLEYRHNVLAFFLGLSFYVMAIVGIAMVSAHSYGG